MGAGLCGKPRGQTCDHIISNTTSSLYKRPAGIIFLEGGFRKSWTSLRKGHPPNRSTSFHPNVNSFFDEPVVGLPEAQRCRMPNIVDMSHDASIIDTWQAIYLPLLLEDQTLSCETSILITNQYLSRKLIPSLHFIPVPALIHFKLSDLSVL